MISWGHEEQQVEPYIYRLQLVPSYIYQWGTVGTNPVCKRGCGYSITSF